jgi:Cu/Ag efflux protein CusF
VRFRLIAFVWFVWLTFGAVLACTAGSDKPDGHYHARGVVVARSGEAGNRELSIHHEALANFADRDNRRTTMESMTMIFGLDPRIAADLQVGDKVAFEFDVRWSKRPVLSITKLSKLPGSTALVLSAAD